MKDGQTIGQWLNWDFDANGALQIKDKKGNSVYHEYLNGYWDKSEYDLKGNEIYHESINGVITDNRTPKIIEHNGRKYQLIP
jgi:hypothetical protein